MLLFSRLRCLFLEFPLVWLSAAAAADNLVGSARWLPLPANASPLALLPHVWDVVAVFVVALVVGVIEQLLAFGAQFSCLIIPGGTIGAEVDLLGPLGNAWHVSEKTPILIGGGVGIAPTWFLHNELKAQGVDHYLIMGSRTANEHFIEHDVGKKLIMCTDDGAFGVSGNVITGLDTIREEIELSTVKLFVCGPAPMMEAVREVAVGENIECEIALETVMACGFGICQGCTMEYVSNGESTDTYRKKWIGLHGWTSV